MGQTGREVEIKEEKRKRGIEEKKYNNSFAMHMNSPLKTPPSRSKGRKYPKLRLGDRYR